MLTFLKGKKGSGKTLFTTIWAEYCSKEQICCNYKLNLSDKSKEILDFDVMLLFSDKLFNSLIVIDEAYIYLDSRHSMSIDNIIASYIPLQDRKRDIDIMLTLQDFSTIDKRYRNIVDNVILCNNNKDKKQFEYQFVSNDYSNTLILDYQNAKKFFNMYDTNQIIFNKKVNNLRYNNITNEDNNILISENIDKFNKFKLDYNIKNNEFKKDFVKHFCNLNDLPCNQNFVNSFYFILQKKDEK